ncbi:sigma 54-interacting transcriptional regulator [Kingella potus]|nr:helix-turn-helix domain-containing protein [Kingella potus]UOP00996.1 sigma 54-interacting transcriptional regulator [Kingella potus]
MQENTVCRTDSSTTRNTNVRIITATTRDLADEVENGWFDADLYYRLYVVPIRLPALRERRSDIPELAAYFMHRINRETGKNLNLTAEAVEQLQHYSWPGNVYELERFLTKLTVQSKGNLADEHAVWQLLKQQPANPAPAPALHTTDKPRAVGFAIQGNQPRPYLQADSHSPEKIEQTLAYCQGNKTQAAQMLGLSTRQLYYRLEKMKQNTAKNGAE